MSSISKQSKAACFCVGKTPGCTCDGSCRCACICNIDKLEPVCYAGLMTEVDPNEGQEIHKTRGGEGTVGQAIIRDKLRKLPPNCS